MASRRKKRLAQTDGDGHSDNETEEWEAREGGGFVRIYPPTTLKRVRRERVEDAKIDDLSIKGRAVIELQRLCH